MQTKQRGSGPDFKFEDKSLAELILGSDKGVQYAGKFSDYKSALMNGALQTLVNILLKTLTRLAVTLKPNGLRKQTI